MSELTKEMVLKFLKNGSRVRIQKSEVFFDPYISFQLIKEGYFQATPIIEDYLSLNLASEIFGEKAVKLIVQYGLQFIIQRQVCLAGSSWFISFALDCMLVRSNRIQEGQGFGQVETVENLSALITLLIDANEIERKLIEFSGGTQNGTIQI